MTTLRRNWSFKEMLRLPKCFHQRPSPGPAQALQVELLEERQMLSTVEIFAAGATGQENLELLIDGQVVQTFEGVSGDPALRDFEGFSYQTARELSADQISLRFANDLFDPATGTDRNLFVDGIIVDGNIFEAEDPATFVTAFWRGNGIVSGNLQTESLNVTGQMDFSSSGISTDTASRLRVTARGTTGEEIFQVVVGGNVVQTFGVETFRQTYEFNTDQALTLDDIQIRFINDRFDAGSGLDRNLVVDGIELVNLADGTRQTVSPLQYSVFSNATFRTEDGIVAGFGRGSTLHTNGFFQFSSTEARSIDGSRNNVTAGLFNAGSTDSELIRVGNSSPVYGGDGSGDQIISDAQRPNARDISNVMSASRAATPNARNLSDMTWLWGQFMDHDISLSEISDGAEVNGSAAIGINDPDDPIGPRPIRFTRSNFETDENGFRQQINDLTAFIDASNVYGSDQRTADALRSFNGGRLKVSAGNLLPIDVDGISTDDGMLGVTGLFSAGEFRANEHVGLTAIHTLFVREHNRLAGLIAAQNPGFSDEQIYQLARKIVNAELQVITYNEFLPALLGDSAPAIADYSYDDTVDPGVLNSFAHAAYRLGHTMLSSSLKLSDGSGNTDSIELRNAFFNPDFIKQDPTRIDQLLQGMIEQRAQEIDTELVEDVRSFLFGQPGSGGMDLASLNIQRGRDHGLPDYNSLREAFGLGRITSFSQITSDTAIASRLANVYGGNFDNIDPWIGGLAEDHLPGSSVGQLFTTIIADQFTRLRDGDRLFYTSDTFGLYSAGHLNDDIRAIVDLDQLSLTSLLEHNTNVRAHQNVFFASDSVRNRLVVNATGQEGSERFRVLVNGQLIGTYTVESNTSRYEFAVADNNIDEVIIEFVNDASDPSTGFDRNLTVDSIQIDSDTFEAEDVYSTGTWRPEDGIVAGIGRGDTLHANGFFQFA